jgi:SNF family Na+-dependent transporter
MLNKIYKINFVLILIILPLFTSAQLSVTRTFFDRAKDLITQVLVPLVFTLALLFFFWGMVKYIQSEDKDKEQAKKMMIWGVVALFVMSSIWGIISFLQDELLISKTTQGKIPTIQ